MRALSRPGGPPWTEGLPPRCITSAQLRLARAPAWRATSVYGTKAAGTAVAAQAGGGGSGGGTPKQPTSSCGDGEDGARAPGPFDLGSWTAMAAQRLAPLAWLSSVWVAFQVFRGLEEFWRSVARTPDMDARFSKLEDKVDKLDKKLEDKFDKLDKKLEDKVDKLDKKLDLKFDKLQEAVTVIRVEASRREARLFVGQAAGLALLAAWLGRRPGAGRGSV